MMIWKKKKKRLFHSEKRHLLCDFMFPAVWHQAAVPLLTISRLASARPGKHLLRFPGLLESGKDFIGEKKNFSCPTSSSSSPSSHSCTSTFSYSVPILDGQEEEKNNRLSIQRAFSPFLSWPVNPFISCSAL